MTKLLLITFFLIPLSIVSQTYTTDKSEIYTANNEVEDTLNTANNILCIISKIKAEQFIDKGPYKAQVFDTDVMLLVQGPMLKMPLKEAIKITIIRIITRLNLPAK